MENNLKEIWQQAVDGDKKAENKLYTYLFERFKLLAGLTLCKDDAKDIAQDACVAIIKGYKTLKHPYEYNAWAHRIYKNKMANYYQKNSVKQRVVSSSEFDETILSQDNSSQVDHETMITLERCSKKMIKAYPRYMRAINLVQLGYETDEICEKMKLSKNNLYVILSRGRSLLLDCMNKEEKKN